MSKKYIIYLALTILLVIVNLYFFLTPPSCVHNEMYHSLCGTESTVYFVWGLVFWIPYTFWIFVYWVASKLKKTRPARIANIMSLVILAIFIIIMVIFWSFLLSPSYGM